MLFYYLLEEKMAKGLKLKAFINSNIKLTKFKMSLKRKIHNFYFYFF
jgi:hypothetical protein